MINGLAYQFCHRQQGQIPGDGVIEIGNRWIGQLDGGHVRNHGREYKRYRHLPRG